MIELCEEVLLFAKQQNSLPCFLFIVYYLLVYYLFFFIILPKLESQKLLSKTLGWATDVIFFLTYMSCFILAKIFSNMCFWISWLNCRSHKPQRETVWLVTCSASSRVLDLSWVCLSLDPSFFGSLLYLRKLNLQAAIPRAPVTDGFSLRLSKRRHQQNIWGRTKEKSQDTPSPPICAVFCCVTPASFHQAYWVPDATAWLRL